MKKTVPAVVLSLLCGPSKAHALVQDPYQWDPLLGSATIDQVYTPVTPCRFVDGINAADRVSSAANGTTARYYRVRGNTPSDFVSQGAAATAPTGCGVPTTATAVMVNLTVADPDADGDLKVDPADVMAPSATSVLNYTFGGVRGKNLANGVVVKLCDLTMGACASDTDPTLPTRDILVTFHAGASLVSTYFIADVLGYFAPAIVSSGGVTSVTASAPLGSRGGATPDISLTGVVGIGNGGTGAATQNFVDLTTNQTVAGAKTFSSPIVGSVTGSAGSVAGVLPVANGGTGSSTKSFVDLTTTQTVGGNKTLTGNLVLGASTASTGNIMKGGSRFIHNFGTNNTFIGENAGNLTMTGSSNTGSGVNALGSNTTGLSNTVSGMNALASNTTGNNNTASGVGTMVSNASGNFNTAAGVNALASNTTGSNNTAIGFGANVSTGALTNATAIGNGATVNASNKIRLGDASVTVIEGQVAYSFSSDRTKKENFRSVDAQEVLGKLRDMSVTSWNYIGHDARESRHYGPMAQDFFAAFGRDEVGAIGNDTTINSGDITGILMIGLKGLDVQMQKDQRTISAQAAEIAALKLQVARIEEMERKVASMAGLLKTLVEPSVTQASLLTTPQEQP